MTRSTSAHRRAISSLLTPAQQLSSMCTTAVPLMMVFTIAMMLTSVNGMSSFQKPCASRLDAFDW
jgi:Sec-independent protein secretion pathway component TatC